MSGLEFDGVNGDFFSLLLLFLLDRNININYYIECVRSSQTFCVNRWKIGTEIQQKEEEMKN